MPSYTEAIVLGNLTDAPATIHRYTGFVSAIGIAEQFLGSPPYSNQNQTSLVYVRFTRQPDSAPLTGIYIVPGKITPLKVKYVEFPIDNVNSILLLN